MFTDNFNTHYMYEIWYDCVLLNYWSRNSFANIHIIQLLIDAMLSSSSESLCKSNLKGSKQVSAGVSFGFKEANWVKRILNLKGIPHWVNNFIRLCDYWSGSFLLSGFNCYCVLQQFVNCSTARWLYLHIDVNKWITTALFSPVFSVRIHWTGSGGEAEFEMAFVAGTC